MAHLSGLASHTCTQTHWYVGCVCLVAGFSPMLCVSSLLRLQYMLCSFFCLSVCFVHSWHFMEDIILQPVCQSAEKAVFLLLFNMCSSETGCLNAISKFTDIFFFLSSLFLPHSPKQCVFVVKLRLRQASKFHPCCFDWLCHRTERFMPLLLMLCGRFLSVCDLFSNTPTRPDSPPSLSSVNQ